MAGDPNAPALNYPPPFPGFPPKNWLDSQESSYDLNIRILVTAIVCIVFVIVLVVVLNLYGRYVLRRDRIRRWPTVTIFRSTILATEPTRAGLDSASIARIPKFAYKPTSSESPAECSICLSVAEEGEVVRVLPSCKHVFHVDCIDMWLHSHTTCPVCRAGAEPLASAELRLEVGEASGRVPPLEIGGVDDGEGTSGAKEGSSTSLLSSSFRAMFSRERSTRGVQADGVEDLERQQ